MPRAASFVMRCQPTSARRRSSALKVIAAKCPVNRTIEGESPSMSGSSGLTLRADLDGALCTRPRAQEMEVHGVDGTRRAGDALCGRCGRRGQEVSPPAGRHAPPRRGDRRSPAAAARDGETLAAEALRESHEERGLRPEA